MTRFALRTEVSTCSYSPGNGETLLVLTCMQPFLSKLVHSRCIIAKVAFQRYQNQLEKGEYSLSLPHRYHCSLSPLGSIQ